MRIPKDAKNLEKFAKTTIEDCLVSQGKRAAAYRQYGQWIETGRAAGGLALANLIYSHLDRLASHLFSPSELRFAVDYENHYPQEWIRKGEVAARVVSREWEAKNVDMLFGHGVKEALGYGACFLKQLVKRVSAPEGEAGNAVAYNGARLVLPWQMGVYDETVNDLGEQEAFVETVYLNKHEVWRRVRNLPDAEKLYKRVLSNAKKEEGVGTPTSFMHQVLSTAVLNTTSVQSATQPLPGGIVQLTNDPNYAILGPQVAAEMYPMHELWVKDDSRSEDYTTIQMFDPDIIVAPQFRHINLFCPDTQPYTLIQPNFVAGYFWGRSEIVDLMQLQDWLTTHLDDAKRLVGQQIDKILAFIGQDGITDEAYAVFRAQGYIGLTPGSDVKDLTPKLPDQLLPMIMEIIQLMDRVSGFPPVMSGQGDQGVRSDLHANTLLKTGSPRLRDRSLLVERNCASAADTTLAVLQAKQAKAYWTDINDVLSDFTLEQLPEDRRISVDAHSGSPIYADDHANLTVAGVKLGFIDGESAIEELPYAHKDKLINRLKAKQAAEAKMVKEHPELLAPNRKARERQIGSAAEGMSEPGIVGAPH